VFGSTDVPKRMPCSASCLVLAQRLIATTSNDNAIVLLEVLQPNKTEVLGYLNGKNGPPERWARVLVAQGATDEAFAVDYMVCIPKHDFGTQAAAVSTAFSSTLNSSRAERSPLFRHAFLYRCTTEHSAYAPAWRLVSG